MSETAIRVQNVTKLYKLYDKPSDRFRESLGLTKKVLHREHYALHDLNFDIKKGECVGIIGTNGSGKSTILKIITGVLNPTSGNVEIDGRISALLELGAGFNMEYTGLEECVFKWNYDWTLPRRRLMQSWIQYWNLQILESLFISRLKHILPVCLYGWLLQ